MTQESLKRRMASSLDDIIRGRLDLSENMDEQESEELVDYEPDHSPG